MAATPLDGRALAAKVRARVKEEVAGLGGLKLATVLVGDDPASHRYIALKHKAAEEVGIEPLDLRLPADIPEEELLDVLHVLNVATGVAGIVDPEMVKQGAAVVDVGQNQTEAGLVGDVDPGVSERAAFLTPVPGGVGPMTIAMLLENTVLAARYRRGALAFPR